MKLRALFLTALLNAMSIHFLSRLLLVTAIKAATDSPELLRLK